MRTGYHSARQDVGVGLYPRDDLTQDDPVGEHVHLQRGRRAAQRDTAGDDHIQLIFHFK